jgi:hypothetical protein
MEKSEMMKKFEAETVKKSVRVMTDAPIEGQGEFL